MYDIALTLMGTTKDMKVLLTLFFVEKYVNGAIIQWERIQEDKNRFLGLGPRVGSRLMSTLFLDVHFYFVCGDKVQNLYKGFIDIDGGQDLQHLWAKYQLMFKDFNNARNHLEHLDQRVQAGSHTDFGNLMGDTYIFWGERFDIGPMSLGKLKDSYEDLIGILRLRQNPISI